MQEVELPEMLRGSERVALSGGKFSEADFGGEAGRFGEELYLPNFVPNLLPLPRTAPSHYDQSFTALPLGPCVFMVRMSAS